MPCRNNDARGARGHNLEDGGGEGRRPEGRREGRHYSHLNTKADSVTQTTNTSASAPRSPVCADHASPRHAPFISDTAYPTGSIRASACAQSGRMAIGKNSPDNTT